MSWRISYGPQIPKDLRKLDKPVRKRILDYLDDVVAGDDPRDRGKALTGNLAGLWRYRVGDYRVIVEIRDDVLVVVALAIAHRSEVYRPRK